VFPEFNVKRDLWISGLVVKLQRRKETRECPLRSGYNETDRSIAQRLTHWLELHTEVSDLVGIVQYMNYGLVGGAVASICCRSCCVESSSVLSSSQSSWNSWVSSPCPTCSSQFDPSNSYVMHDSDEEKVRSEMLSSRLTFDRSSLLLRSA
jgi:hypothetical protein